MPTFSSSRSNLPEAKVNIPRLITLTKEVPEMPRIDFVLLLRLTVLAGFVCQLDTSWSYHRERSFSWGNASMRSSCGAFSQLVIKVRGPLVVGNISGL